MNTLKLQSSKRSSNYEQIWRGVYRKRWGEKSLSQGEDDFILFSVSTYTQGLDFEPKNAKFLQMAAKVMHSHSYP